MQSFLGLANYRRQFIRNFAGISAPLSELTKKGVSLNWGQDIRIFQNLKDEFQSTPLFPWRILESRSL
jgi:hypothetical protein